MDKQEAIERLKQNKAAAEFYAGMVQNTNAIEIELKGIEAIDMAIEALSADVVRCKDCIHYESDGGAMMVCSVTDMVCDNDDYCSYGERREDGEV